MGEPLGWLDEVFSSIQGEGPWIGRRQLFLRFAGCRRSCAYCDTISARRLRPSSWTLETAPGQSVRTPNPVAVPALLDLIRSQWERRGPFHSLSLTGGEPLEQGKFVVDLLRALRRWHPRVLVLLETNGLEPAALRLTAGWVDLVSLDLKLPSATGRTWAGRLHRDCLRAAGRRPGCAKVVITPRTRPHEVVRAARLVQDTVPDWELYLQPDGSRTWSQGDRGVLLDTLLRTALREHARTRLVPQVQRTLGVK